MAAATTTGTAIGDVGSNKKSSASGIGKTSDVPVGSGKIYESARVVVTQPTAGNFKAFTAVCTHQGCLVASFSGNAIVCPCHGSEFSIKDGSVLAGPATAPLKETPITVSGTTLKLG
jgi:Rieske Fe-S protein